MVEHLAKNFPEGLILDRPAGEVHMGSVDENWVNSSTDMQRRTRRDPINAAGCKAHANGLSSGAQAFWCS